MDFTERALLLDPSPMPLELGWQRSDSGVLHIAVRTDMPGCTGEMLEWWFASRPTTREYRWWHPLDHVSSTWAEGTDGTLVNSIHQVVERFTGLPEQTLSIQFRDPVEFFDSAAIESARKARHVSALLCIAGGESHRPHRTPDGTVIGTRLIHVGRDTPWGLVLRSHYFMGQDLAGKMPLAELSAIFPDALGPNMLQHCYDEFSFLSKLLPGIWLAEGSAPQVITRPW